MLASYIFYSLTDLRYSLILLGCTAISYTAARAMAHTHDPKTRKGWMLAGVLLNLTIMNLSTAG